MQHLIGALNVERGFAKQPLGSPYTQRGVCRPFCLPLYISGLYSFYQIRVEFERLGEPQCEIEAAQPCGSTAVWIIPGNLRSTISISIALRLVLRVGLENWS